jgi:hypothetical protein
MAQPPATRSRPRRTLLINPAFQFKYTGLLVGVVLVVMVILGAVIWQTMDAAAANAVMAAAQAERATQAAEDSSRVALMDQMMRSADNPEAMATIERELNASLAQSRRERSEVGARRDAAQRHRRRMMAILLGGGATLVVLLGLLAIYITQKIVGPAFKLKRLMRRVGTGRLVVRERLRKGDELEDLFDTFMQMTYSLMALQQGRLATVDLAITRAQRGGADPELLQTLAALRAQLLLGLPAEAARPASKSA